MRKILLIVCLLCGRPASAAISLVQCQNVTNHGGTSTVPISPTNGNTLVAGVTGDTSTSGVIAISSVKDQANNAFTADGSLVNPGATTAGEEQFFHLSNVSGVTSVIVTWASSQYAVVFVCEVSGLAASPLDVADTVGNQNNLATWTSVGILSTNAQDIVFSVLYKPATDTTYTCTAPWLLPANGTTSDTPNGQSGVLCYQIVSSISTYTPTGTDIASAWSVISGSYKALAASGGASKIAGSAKIAGPVKTD